MKAKLSERVVKAAAIGSRKYVLLDEDTPGFGLCVYESGRKGFVLIYRIAGQQKRFTIGVWPTWSVTAARDEAKRLIREIDRGEDPLDTRKAARGAPTVKELAERFIEEHLPKLAPTNASDQKSMLEKLVLPEWKNRKVADITPTDVDRLLTKIAAGRARPSKKKPTQKRRKKLAPPKPTPVRANRAGEMLRKMFNLAMLWKMRTDNPAFGFRRRPEVARDRFLSFEEIERLANALAVDEDLDVKVYDPNVSIAHGLDAGAVGRGNDVVPDLRDRMVPTIEALIDTAGVILVGNTYDEAKAPLARAIDHLLGLIPYQPIPHDDVTLPEPVFNPDYERAVLPPALYVPSKYEYPLTPRATVLRRLKRRGKCRAKP